MLTATRRPARTMSARSPLLRNCGPPWMPKFGFEYTGGGVIATSSTKYTFWPSCASDPMSGFSYRMLETFT